MIIVHNLQFGIYMGKSVFIAFAGDRKFNAQFRPSDTFGKRLQKRLVCSGNSGFLPQDMAFRSTPSGKLTN